MELQCVGRGRLAGVVWVESTAGLHMSHITHHTHLNFAHVGISGSNHVVVSHVLLLARRVRLCQIVTEPRVWVA